MEKGSEKEDLPLKRTVTLPAVGAGSHAGAGGGEGAVVPSVGLAGPHVQSLPTFFPLMITDEEELLLLFATVVVLLLFCSLSMWAWQNLSFLGTWW